MENDFPHREKARRDNVEPMFMCANTLNAPPQLVFPSTESEDPRRTTFLRDKAEPSRQKLNIESEVPS
jgi:hypothetical protein